MTNFEASTPQLAPFQLPILRTNRDPNAPSVFISYSQTQDNNNAHQNWVANFARKIGQLGINISHDSSVDGEETFTEFMNRINHDKFVICVCSESYVEKANSQENRSGVIWEIELMNSMGRLKTPLKSFLIPIIKDGSPKPFPNNFPALVSQHDVVGHSFENQQDAMGSFAKIIGRILDIKNKISDSIIDNEQYKKYGQQISDKFYNTVARYWNAPANSQEERKLCSLINSGELIKCPEEKTDSDFDAHHNEKVLISMGHWDNSYSGDQEILSLLSEDSNNEQ